ncbi:MAG: DNA repair protein RadC [Muribaculaceae bacterium]|nr:DNA repair protein RadC [Muribaculaceae bacterium]
MHTDKDTTPTYRGRIADMATDDKPREKAVRLGIQSLTDTELLAIILGGGIPGKSVMDLSREILAECDGKLSNLAQMSIMGMVKKFSGVGTAKAVSVAAALQLGSRLRTAQAPATQITTSMVAYEALAPIISSLPTEEFWMLILNRANVIRAKICISRGGTAATYVEPKIVVKNALDYMASGIIVAHNHPSGHIRPSKEDDRLTLRIKEAAALLDIKLLDHIIVGQGSYYSYADEGRI